MVANSNDIIWKTLLNILKKTLTLIDIKIIKKLIKNIEKKIKIIYIIFKIKYKIKYIINYIYNYKIKFNNFVIYILWLLFDKIKRKL